MQADARLIEDIQHAHQARTYLRRKPYPLALAARKRRRRAGQRKITQPDADEEAEPCLYLLDDAFGDHRVLFVELKPVYEFQRLEYRKLRKLGDVHPADRDGERGLFEPAPIALRAIHLGHALLDIRAHRGALRLPVAALEIIDDALKFAFYNAEALVLFVSQLERLALCAVEDRVYRLLRQLLYRVCELEVVALCERVEVHSRYRVPAHVVPARGRNSPVHYAEVRVRHDKLRVDEHLHAESRTLGARTVRTVERKQPRRQLLYGYAAVVTGVVLRERELLPAARQIDVHQPARERERRLGRVREPAGNVRLYYESVDDYLYIVLLVLFKLYLFRKIVYRPVHACADISGLLCILEHLDVLALF